MKQASDMVKNFFEAYERGSNGADPEPLVALYSDSFMFGGPQGDWDLMERVQALGLLPGKA